MASTLKLEFGVVNYHWESVGGDATALFEESVAWRGELLLTGPVVIHKVGPILTPGSQDTYRVSGPLMNPPQEFDSFEEAVKTAEFVVRETGHAVDGR